MLFVRIINGSLQCIRLQVKGFLTRQQSPTRPSGTTRKPTMPEQPTSSKLRRLPNVDQRGKGTIPKEMTTILTSTKLARNDFSCLGQAKIQPRSQQPECLSTDPYCETFPFAKILGDRANPSRVDNRKKMLSGTSQKMKARKAGTNPGMRTSIRRPHSLFCTVKEEMNSTLPTTSNTIQDTIQSDDLSRVIKQGIHKNTPAVGSGIPSSRNQRIQGAAMGGGGGGASTPCNTNGAEIVWSTPSFSRNRRPSTDCRTFTNLSTNTLGSGRSTLPLGLPPTSTQDARWNPGEEPVLHVLQTYISPSAMDHWQNTQRSLTSRSGVPFFFWDHGKS